MTIQGKLKSVKNTLSRDAGIADGAQCTSQLGWMLLLKILEDRDCEYEQLDQDYRSPLPPRLRWQAWARNGHNDDELLEFLNAELFPKLRALPVDHARDRRTAVIRAVFEGARNHATNGAVLRQAIEKLDRIDFSPSAEFENRAEDFAAFLRELHESNEVGDAHTPRAVARFLVDRVAPKLGESVLDPACGTGSLLIATLDYVREHGAQSALDEAILQRSVRGIEKTICRTCWRPPTSCSTESRFPRTCNATTPCRGRSPPIVKTTWSTSSFRPCLSKAPKSFSFNRSFRPTSKPAKAPTCSSCSSCTCSNAAAAPASP
ncbi:MAG: SAM-dependent DNA methyltransferase [Thermoanaerobaculia bacterium]|nr:SAM-dependent DNA methyltransferase [Thermoanaerobaculia bacterium]